MTAAGQSSPRRAPPAGADAVMALFAAVAAALALVEGPRTPLVVGMVLLALAPWPVLLAGRDVPVAALAVLGTAPVAVVVLVRGPGSAVFLTTVAASWVAARVDRAGAVVALTAGVVVLPSLGLLSGEQWDGGAVYFGFGNAFGVLFGALLRRATRLAADLRVAQERLAEAAAREERRRIARDVHDLVAHSLTVVVLHVGGARRVLRQRPAAAEEALREAERVCREGLDGVRGVVGLLRDEDGGLPSPSLDLAELAGSYRAAGVPVELRVRGAVGELPLVARVTLHRVVQEALANAARHGRPGAPVEVDVVVDAGGVSARVVSAAGPAGDLADGSGGEEPAGGFGGGFGGHGLRGLREQVASLGGELSSGPDAGRPGSWLVACALPVARTAGAA